MTTYEICEVPDYTVIYESSNKLNKPINVLSTLILQDYQLHERLFKNDMLKLAVDIDKLRDYKPDYSFKHVIDDICDYVKIDNNDISFTTNFGVETGSHHVVIPKYCMKASFQKEYWMLFRKKYGYGNEIDGNIFGKEKSGGWFRLPNQTGVVKEKIKGKWVVKDVKKPHLIQRGEIEDFVLKYVEKAEVYPFEPTMKEEKTDKKKTIKKKTIKKKIEESETDTETINSDNTINEEKIELLKALIDCLTPYRCDTYDDWISVGMILKNEGADESLFHYFSKKSNKYDEEHTTYKWNSFKRSGLTIGTLHKYAQEDNLNMYYSKVLKTTIANDDNKAGNIIYKELKDRLIPSKGRFYFKMNNIWTNDMETIDNFIMKYILNSGIKKMDKEGKIIPYAQNIKGAKSIREVVYNNVNTQENPPEIHTLFHTTTKNRIAFLDGVLDFKERKFYLWRDIDFSYYTTVCINRNFKPYFDNPDITKIEEIKQKIFNPLFGDKVDRGFHFLSRALSGNFQDKNFGTYLGNRDCGKGVMFDALKCSFEDYVLSFEVRNIMYQRKTNTNNDEVSRKMYWLLDYEFTRLAISQEVPKTEQNMIVNSEKLKKLASGGDEQTARRNYDRKDTKFYIDTTFLFMGNDDLQFDSKDVKEHEVEFSSVKQFKTAEEIEDMRKDGFSEEVISSYGIKDETLKASCHTDEYKNAIMYLIYNAFTDKAVHIQKVIDDENDETCLKFRLLEKLEFTKNLEDMVLVQRIKELFVDDKPKKISNELEALGAFKKKINVKTSEFCGLWCFLGIRLK
jgi:hypothetical protein